MRTTLFADGTYISGHLECLCDSNHRTAYKHANQKIQRANSDCSPPPPPGGAYKFGESDTWLRTPSDLTEYRGGPSIFYKSMWIRHLGYEHLERDSCYNLVWNPALEARPTYINEKYGTNQGERVCMVEFPPASKGASSSAASDPAKREEPVEQGPLPTSGIAFQTRSAGNPWGRSDPEMMEQWEQEKAAAEEEKEYQKECRYCAFGLGSNEPRCTCKRKTECIDLTIEDPEVVDGA